MILLSFANYVRRLRTDERGTVAITMAVLMVPLIGALGVGFEVSNWYMTSRGMQNAADSAALAAAINGGANYDVEARAVAARYGFVDGVNNVSVVVSNTAACADGSNNCYSVAISGSVPLFLSQIVGFKGDGKLNGVAQKELGAQSVAQAATSNQFCLLALGPGGLNTNGAPKANLGCNVASNASATCNGHNLGAPIGVAHGTNNGCGISQISNFPIVVDPYVGLASNIPADPCKGVYPQEPGKKGSSLPPSNVWTTGHKLLSGNTTICGDLQLTGDVTIDTPLGGTGAVLTIFNGQLDTGSNSITTSKGSGLTVVFSGDNLGSYTHAPTGGGTLDIAAPTSGPWQGVAIYQDPKLTSGVDISAAGNSPTWDITGLVYLSKASVTFSGAVGKSGNGNSCFVLVVSDITINGTGSILPNTACGPAGLSATPTGHAGGKLVL